MKKISAILTILTLSFLTACGLPLRYTEVHGSGNLATETRHLAGINSVELSGIGTLIIEQGDEESLQVTAEDNLLDYLISRTVGSNLSLGVEDFVNIQPTQNITYHLKVKDLSAIETSGLGNVDINSLQTDQIRLSISGTGSVTIGDLQVEVLDLEISGSGSMSIADLQAGFSSLDISGLGNVDLSGTVDDQDVEISGAGSYNAVDLFSRTADLEISGSGSAAVWASDKLDLELSGVGNLEYYGDPILNTEISGVGTVRSLGGK